MRSRENGEKEKKERRWGRRCRRIWDHLGLVSVEAAVVDDGNCEEAWEASLRKAREEADGGRGEDGEMRAGRNETQEGFLVGLRRERKEEGKGEDEDKEEKGEDGPREKGRH